MKVPAALLALAVTSTASQADRFRPLGPVPTETMRTRGCHGAAGPTGSSTSACVLGEEGLRVSQGGAVEIHPGIRGRALSVQGRRLLVETAEGEVLAYLDTSAAAQLHEVSVLDNFFDPPHLIVAPGDTVRWTNATGLFHNVFSCTADQLGCDGAEAAESFTSGSATEFFVFEHTFTRAGANPYLCQPHAPFMQGSVTVTGEGGTPPPVPAGMQVAKLASDGSSLSLSWDTSCAPADHQILHGYAFGLPGSTGGGYEPSDGQCGIGASAPYAWTGVPPAFPVATGWLWWVVVATDGAATEGSWGTDGSGAERQGPGQGGSSGVCGIAAKSLVNGCVP